MEERRAILELLSRAHRGALRFMISRDTRPGDKLLFLAHWICLRGFGLSRAARCPPPRARPAGVPLPLIDISDPGQRRPAARPAPEEATATRVLVTRAMGGAGDLLMMTPGLNALARRHPGRVDFAIPRNLFPLLENNPDVRLIDIHSELDPRGYGRWFNLTDCPAARIESLTAPRVRQGRIESFARAMGTRGGSLRRMPRRPRYFPHGPGAGGARAFLCVPRPRRARRDRGPVPLGRELSRLPAHAVRDRGPGPRVRGPGLRQPGDAGLRLPRRGPGGSAARCAKSLRLRAAVRRSWPRTRCSCTWPEPWTCLAWRSSGPPTAECARRSIHACRFLDVRRELACVPCWRNERIRCALTGRHASVCLAEIRVADVVEAVHQLLCERPAVAPASRPAGLRASL